MFDESKEKVQHGPVEDKDSSLPSKNIDFNEKRNTFVHFCIVAFQWISIVQLSVQFAVQYIVQFSE